MPRNLTIVLVCLVALFAFLAWCKAWVTFGILAFLVALLAFLIWWREKIIEPDNERLRMAIRGFRRFQEEASRGSSDGGL
jgi:cytochrome b subunit of formate dehydrogenase